MSLTTINPSSLPGPSGFSYAVRSEGRIVVHFAGHTAVDEQGMIDGRLTLLEQFRRTVENLQQSAQAAEVDPGDFAKLTIYVTDVSAYRRASSEIGEIYRQVFVDHYPAMTLIEVSRLWDENALIEIDGVAVT